jgi:hypothetical protein
VDNACVDPVLPPPRPAPTCPYTVTLTNIGVDCVGGFSDINFYDENDQLVDVIDVDLDDITFTKELHYNNGLFDVEGGGMYYQLTAITHDVDVTPPNKQAVQTLDGLGQIETVRVPWESDELQDMIPDFVRQTGFTYSVKCCNKYREPILIEHRPWYSSKQTEYGTPSSVGRHPSAMLDNNETTHFLYASKFGDQPASITFVTEKPFSRMAITRHEDLWRDGRDKHHDPRNADGSILENIHDGPSPVYLTTRYKTDVGYRYPKPYCDFNIKITSDCSDLVVDRNRTYDRIGNIQPYTDTYIEVSPTALTEQLRKTAICAHNANPPSGYPNCGDSGELFSTDIFIEKLTDWNSTFVTLVDENRTSAEMMDVFMYGVNLGLSYQEMLEAIMPENLEGVSNRYNIDGGNTRKISFYTKSLEKLGTDNDHMILLKTLLEYYPEYVRAVLLSSKYHFTTADKSFFFPTDSSWIDAQDEAYVMLTSSLVYELYTVNTTNFVDMLQIPTVKEVIDSACTDGLFTPKSDNMASFLLYDMDSEKVSFPDFKFRSPCNPYLVSKYKNDPKMMSKFRTAVIVTEQYAVSKYNNIVTTIPSAFGKVLLKQFLSHPNSNGFIGYILDEVELNVFAKWKTWFEQNTRSVDDTVDFLEKALRGEDFYQLVMITRDITPMLVETDLNAYKRHVGDTVEFVAKKLVTFAEISKTRVEDFHWLVYVFFYGNPEMLICHVENRCLLFNMIERTMKQKDVFGNYIEGQYSASRIAHLIDYTYHILLEWGFDKNDLENIHKTGIKTGTKAWKIWFNSPNGVDGVRDAYANPELLPAELTLTFNDRINHKLHNNNLDCMEYTSVEENYREEVRLPKYEKTNEILQWKRGYAEVIQVLLTQHYIKTIGEFFEKRQIPKEVQKNYFRKAFSPMCNKGLSLAYGRGEDRNRGVEKFLMFLFVEAVIQAALMLVTRGLASIAPVYFFRAVNFVRSNKFLVRVAGQTYAKTRALFNARPVLILKPYHYSKSYTELYRYQRFINGVYNMQSSKWVAKAMVANANSFGTKAFQLVQRNGRWAVGNIDVAKAATAPGSLELARPFFHRMLFVPPSFGTGLQLTYTGVYALMSTVFATAGIPLIYEMSASANDPDTKQYLLFNDKDKRYDFRIMLAELYAYITQTVETVTEEMIENAKFRIETFTDENNEDAYEHSSRVLLHPRTIVEHGDFVERTLGESREYYNQFIDLVLNDDFFKMEDNDNFFCDDDTFDVFGGNTCGTTRYDDTDGPYN